MTTPNSRTKIVERIQKLQALAEKGGSVEEGLAAARKVIELMDAYSVTADELQSHSYQEVKPITIYAKIPEPVNHNLLMALVLAGGLKTFKVAVTNPMAGIPAKLRKLTEARKPELVVMAMDEQSAKDAVHLWSLLILLRESNLKKSYRKAYRDGFRTQGFKTSYRNGFAVAIEELVRTHEEARTAETSTAIIHIGEKLDRFYKMQTKGGQHNVKARSSHNDLGYLEGVEKGHEVGSQLLNQKSKLDSSRPNHLLED